jgi:uncharacterized membrane protein
MGRRRCVIAATANRPQKELSCVTFADTASNMRQVNAVRLSCTATTTTSVVKGARSAFFYIQTQIRSELAATVFILFSLAFGSAIVFIVPPLRGPDEIAHFLRIYSYMHGEILPAAEVDGRKGIFVERELYNKLHFFRTAGEWFASSREQGVRYGQIMPLYRDFVDTVGDEVDRAVVFAPFAGTEGYNPVAYFPYIVAGVIGFRLDFPNLLLLMRLLGLVTFAAVAAYAIAVTPVLKWSFVLIALLPVSLYNRSVLSADGAALSSAMVVSALCLRAAHGRGAGQPWERSLWMTLCALSKQPQIVFVFLELVVYRLKELPRRWCSVTIVVLPCLVLSPLWVVAVSAEMAAWRLQLEEQHPPEHFNPMWKLSYMWEHPSHFPLAAWRSLSGWWERLWQELIGILGWQDILLQPWTYLTLTAFLMLLPLQKLQLGGAARARVMVITGLTVLGYVAVVYLIFFLTYTPIDIDHVRGVQGRYFVIALPVAAIFVAAAINVELPHGVPPLIATVAAMISGIATVQALFQAHW